ncbi:MAG: dTDP-4-dehydrorhamnose reductase [Sphingomicrobium sp.]
MKVLVIGSSGQLARSLVERAQGRAGIELVAVGRPQIDLEIPDSAARAVAAAGPDVVINAAAYTAVDQAEDEPVRAYRINAEAAGEIAAATAGNARLIHISTDYVFDGRAEGAYAEDAATSPLNVYGQGKLAGEANVRSANPEHVIVRTSWVYSPFGHNFVTAMMAAAECKDRLTVVDDQRGCPTSALDLADGLLRIIDAWGRRSRTGQGETYHLTGTGPTSWCGFAQAIMDERRTHGAKAAAVASIESKDWPTRAERPRNSVLDCGKFRRDFGFALPEWRPSLAGIIGRLAQQE